MAIAAGLGQGIGDRAGRTTNLERPRAGDASCAHRQFGRLGGKKAGICVQACAWIRRARAARQRRRRPGAPAPSGDAWRGLCRAAKGCEALPGNRWRTLMDGSPRVGLPRGYLSSFRPCVTAAGAAGLDAAWRMGADICVALARWSNQSPANGTMVAGRHRSEEHTSELQSLTN